MGQRAGSAPTAPGPAGHPGGHPAEEERRARAVSRVASFTDAVVAIALTLLVLPLVDVARTTPPDSSVGELFADNFGDVIAFVLSFLVIYRFWSSQRRLFTRLVDFDETLWTLNTFWLLGIVFLPFPTARLFVESDLRTDAALLYLGNMLVISLIGVAQVRHIVHHPALHHADTARVMRDQLRASTVTSGVFALATLVAAFVPEVGLLALLLLPLARFGASRST